MTKTDNLTPLAIRELLTHSFVVPKYQRGYRWTTRQVTELLDDVLAFVDAAVGGFYCLQPIVVTRRDTAWELIDGQQRLTTLFLILSYFNNRLAEDSRQDLFSLEYDTRPESRAYLKSLDPSRKDENIDFFYMYNAYQAVRDWFKPRKHRNNDVESAFLNKVKVIWYEVDQQDDPIRIFARLNVGKIPLTNAELVKGLFLRSSNFAADENRLRHLKQTRIAQEWDDIERRLQDDSFWYFLTNERPRSNRIDFLLRLYATQWIQVGPELQRDPSFVFLAFNERLNMDGTDASSEWTRVKQLFLRLDEWYRDRHFYHLIGFLVFHRTAIGQIMALAKDCVTKTAFRRALKNQILQGLLGSRNALGRSAVPAAIESCLADLDYPGDSKRIKEVLLLFNIASLLESDRVKARFPFDLFKVEAWDIEHVRAVHSAMPERTDDRKRWLGNVLAYATGKTELVDQERELEAHPTMEHGDACRAALRLLQTVPFNDEEFEPLFVDIIERFDPEHNAETDNSIGNLTLLDASTNRSYKNAIFPAKRKILIALDKSGKFIPLCTKNAFLKYYSPKIDAMLIWTKDDAAAHQTAMHGALVRFFTTDEVTA